MKRYGIDVTEILKRTVIVEANSCQQAIQKVERAVGEDKILLDTDDFEDRVIKSSDYWCSGEVPEDEDVSFFDHLNEKGDIDKSEIFC